MCAEPTQGVYDLSFAFCWSMPILPSKLRPQLSRIIACSSCLRDMIAKGRMIIQDQLKREGGMKPQVDFPRYFFEFFICSLTRLDLNAICSSLFRAMGPCNEPVVACAGYHGGESGAFIYRMFHHDMNLYLPKYKSYFLLGAIHL